MLTRLRSSWQAAVATSLPTPGATAPTGATAWAWAHGVSPAPQQQQQQHQQQQHLCGNQALQSSGWHDALRRGPDRTMTRLAAVPPAEPSSVAALIHTAHEVLRPNARPAAAQIEQLRRLAGSITLPELGFPAEAQQDPALVAAHLMRHHPSHPSLRGHVTYLPIYDHPRFSVGIFMLPRAGVSIPLHDHPGMSVISQLLYGSMHLAAYDLVAQPLPGQPQAGATGGPALPVSLQSSSLAQAVAAVRQALRPSGKPVLGSHLAARFQVDTVITAPADTLVLYPDSCNLHEFTALSPCAVLDLLTPPYDPDLGCSYFHDIGPLSLNGSDPEEKWGAQGQQRPKPGDLRVLKVVDSEFTTHHAPFHGTALW